MTKRNWKSLALLFSISILSFALLLSAIVSTLRLPLLSWSGLTPMLALLLLTLAASRFTVTVTSADGVSQSRKSVADAFVFLAVMIYAVPPASTAGPAIILAALVGFASSYPYSRRHAVIFTTGIAVISTFIAAHAYRLLVGLFASTGVDAPQRGVPLSVFLIPLCFVAVIQYLHTIESLAIAIDAKDQTTHGHVRRTQIYATEMGKLLNVSGAESQALFAGALLHDIGKLAVPEYILNKPGKLTEAEFAKMKIHPTVGGDILKRVHFPYPVEDIVRYHHEKWDGTGYPKGLKRDVIPLVARIISVVDFYDATRCDRPYRKGMRREESVTLLRKMAGTAFDPRVVDIFIQHVEEFDKLIGAEDIQEQVPSEQLDYQTTTRPDAGLAPDTLGTPDHSSGFRSITEAQREVFALHEIAQTIGSSLNLNDTVTLVTNKLRAIVPFDTCIIFTVDDKSGKAVAAHSAGEHVELFSRRRMQVGDGITGWVIANARSMCNASPELDLVGIPDDIAKQFRGVLVSPLLREDGAFGAITLYSKSRTSYTSEHVRLLESVAQHASSALNNALTFEKTKESALTDPLTELPNARSLYMMLEQRIAECQRLNRESLALISIDIDDFKVINDTYGHHIGDRLLASVAAVIRKELRQMDILTRYAGDEFVVIMPMASTLMAGSVGERIRAAIESKKFTVRTGTTVGVKLSMGSACYPAEGETTEELLTAAARSMQHDKHERKTIATLSATPTAVTIDVLT